MAVIGCEGRLDDHSAQIDDLSRNGRDSVVIRDHEGQEGSDLAILAEMRLPPGKTQQRIGVAAVEGDSGIALGNGAIDRRGCLANLGPAEDRGGGKASRFLAVRSRGNDHDAKWAVVAPKCCHPENTNLT